jgi:hypothetical protein
MKSLVTLVLLSLCAPVFAQFRVVPATVEMLEGGKASVLMITSDQERFSLRQPPGFTFRVDAVNKSISFKSADEKTAITFQLTTNSPGTLPDAESLRDRALAETPGASIIYASTCSTGYRAGSFFDLVQVLRAGMSERFRHVFVPGPSGMAEFVFATDNSDFESKRFIFSGFLNSFRMETPGNRPLAQD